MISATSRIFRHGSNKLSEQHKTIHPITYCNAYESNHVPITCADPWGAGSIWAGESATFLADHSGGYLYMSWKDHSVGQQHGLRLIEGYVEFDKVISWYMSNLAICRGPLVERHRRSKTTPLSSQKAKPRQDLAKSLRDLGFSTRLYFF